MTRIALFIRKIFNLIFNKQKNILSVQNIANNFKFHFEILINILIKLNQSF